MSLKSPHFLTGPTHASSYKVSQEIHDFFRCCCLSSGYLQYIYAEFSVRLFEEAKRRGMVPQPNPQNEVILVQIMSELGFNSDGGAATVAKISQAVEEVRQQVAEERRPTPAPAPVSLFPGAKQRAAKGK